MRPRIRRIDVDVTELESSEVWRGPPEPAVDFHTGLGKHPQLVGVLYLLPKLASVPSTAGGMLIAMELVRGCDLGAALAGAGALYAGGAAAAGAGGGSLSPIFALNLSATLR